MASECRKTGFLDRIDLAGWLLMLCGVVVVGSTVLIPAYLDREDLRRQNEAMAAQLQLLKKQHQAHQDFKTAITSNDSQLLKRLGWEYLNLKPADAERSIMDAGRAESWKHPAAATTDLPPIPEPAPRGRAASSLLIRYTTGQTTRPWVMGLGGWLILMGVLLNPARDATKSEAA